MFRKEISFIRSTELMRLEIFEARSFILHYFTFQNATLIQFSDGSTSNGINFVTYMDITL